MNGVRQQAIRHQPPLKRFGERTLAVLLSVGIHLFFAFIMWAGVSFHFSSQQPLVAATTVQATVVDISDLLAQRQVQQDKINEANRAAREKREAEELHKELMERQRRQREQAERARRERTDAERQEQQRLAEEARQRAAEAERQLADLRAQREQARREREAEERRLQELEQQRLAEAEQQIKDLEQQRMQQLLAEEQAREAASERSSLMAEYVFAIRARVTGNWLRPPTAQPGLKCRIRVNQIPGGEVISATVISPCNADETVRRSITNAVLRSQPLPYQGFESVFEREIAFSFSYDG